MSSLTGKTAIIFGVANERSIAWGIARALHEQGAEVGFSYHPAVEKHARPLAEQLGARYFEPCDVSLDWQIEASAEKARAIYGQVDILIHAVAFADRAELEGAYLNTSRAGFHTAMDISVYSFTALAHSFAPLMRSGGSLLTLTYYGAEKVAPNYNVMGVAKAALEASVRYLAYDFGHSQHSRQRHLGRANPHAGSLRGGRVQGDVPAFQPAGAAPTEHHDRRHR